MSSKVDSAELILKLYDLRREAKMRQGRDWFFMFTPTSAEDIEKTMMDPEVGAYLRMVTSYWEMAAALVNQGAIDPEMFYKTNGEYFGVYAKIEPFLDELRAKWDMPDAFGELETLIKNQPGGIERLRKTQDWMKEIISQVQQQAASA